MTLKFTSKEFKKILDSLENKSMVWVLVMKLPMTLGYDKVWKTGNEEEAIFMLACFC